MGCKDSNQNYVPGGAKSVLLHTCCAPCSGAIIEWMLQNGITPVIYYCNPNIYPFEEYLVRKNECTRYAQSQGLEIVDADYDHAAWQCSISGYENEPERGARCLECFKTRLLSAARYASEHGFTVFTSTLDSSRWKRHDQIVEAGRWAAAHFPGLTFWERNWRQGGLQQRRSEIIREQDFYNQRYCGCEFSMQAMHDDKKAARQRIKKLVSVMTPESKAAQSDAIWERLEQNKTFQDSTDILIYWSMDDEVQTPAFIQKWTAAGKRFYLPSIQGEDLVVKRYAGTSNLTPGQSFSIPEPTGEPISDLSTITLVIVPGRAFDAQGNRMGRGRGFYDRLLSQLPHAIKAGVSFDCQKLPSVSVDAGDIKMDFVI